MPNFGPYEAEVAFLSGVSDTNTAAAISWFTMDYGADGSLQVPARYGSESIAIKWGSTTPGTAGGNITYWFDAAADWSSTEQSVWTGAFGLWSSLADISFSVAPDAGSANITLKRLPNQQAFAVTGTRTDVAVGSPTVNAIPTSGAYITIDTATNGFGPIDSGPDAKGGYPWSTVVHEIGHVIGLGHSGPYNGMVNLEQQQFGKYDTRQWSIMSYINPGSTETRYFADYPVPGTSWGVADTGERYVPLTPQMLDILAIQRLYGVQTGGPFAGGQIYGFNSNITDPFLKSVFDFGEGYNPSAVVTLWNSGTGNTLDLSGFNQDARIDLGPGSFTSAAGKANNIAIALDTRIETALGGAGNDSIVANSALASTLSGNAGDDRLTGGTQGDTLRGDAGRDDLAGLAGGDRLEGGDGDDELAGGPGDDTLDGGAGDDVLDGGAGIDSLSGGSGADFFQFSAGQASEDTVTDFSGRTGQGDGLQFFGYGLASQGARFEQVDATHWKIVSSDGAIDETVTIANGAAIAADDYAFLSSYTPLASSTFIDYASWRTNDTTGPLAGVRVDASLTFNVALVLDRANDPTSLLNGDWAARARQLAALEESGTLWSTYGADPAKYDAALAALGGLGIRTVDQVRPDNGYVSSVASRTIWVELSSDSFPTLFGPNAQLLASDADGLWYWNGGLSLPTSLAAAGVTGLWFDTDMFGDWMAKPAPARPAPLLPAGAQSPGNSVAMAPLLYPQTIATDYYNLPLGPAVATGTIGLVTPTTGTALPGDPTGNGFQAALDAYRSAAGVPTGAPVIAVAPGGQASPTNGERSTDAGIAGTVAPRSPLVLYAGSGGGNGATANAFTAYQSAFWDSSNDPEIVSSSVGMVSQQAPGSPFYKAGIELFVDAALRGITVLNANGDGGSGNIFANGLVNVNMLRTSPYAVTVGGTSLSSTAVALQDSTLDDLVAKAAAGDLGTLWKLVAAGMTQSPVGMPASGDTLVETVWNQYDRQGTTFPVGYLGNNAGSGGADPSLKTPWYQTAYGLVPFTADPFHLIGRGSPDVSANAGGNLGYLVPGTDMVGTQGEGGTSTSAPLWSGLMAQFNAIFRDQGLPRLGYMTDLLYIASAIAPASFNDITTGNNTSSMVLGGEYISDGFAITPTGYGYEARPGYDLATGLGTPNGMVLARALTTIAHHQMSFADVAPLIESTGTGGWTSGASQTLLVQAATVAKMNVALTLGSQQISTQDGTVADEFAWTARFAQQSLQADFDADLVRLFDRQSHGWVTTADAESGAALAALIGQGQGFARQATLTSAYGLADFSTAPFSTQDEKTQKDVFQTGGTIHLARAVAIAETAGGASDQTAVVRVRQNGQDDLALAFYRVDDLKGAIGGIDPGEVGYAAAVTGRLYSLHDGSTALHGPGYGLYTQAEITNVDARDLIALKLINHTSGDTWFAFAQANGDRLAHLYNYGANSWGFEDTRGGGDHDFNDMVVQLDFTSTAGNQWLV